ACGKGAVQLVGLQVEEGQRVQLAKAVGDLAVEPVDEQRKRGEPLQTTDRAGNRSLDVGQPDRKELELLQLAQARWQRSADALRRAAAADDGQRLQTAQVAKLGRDAAAELVAVEEQRA